MEETLIMSTLFLLIGIFVGILVMIVFQYYKNKKAKEDAEKYLIDAKKEAEQNKKDLILEAKEEVSRIKNELEQEVKEKKQELKQSEERMLSREASLERRDESLAKREQSLEDRENNLFKKQEDIQLEQEEVEKLKEKQLLELQKISGYSKEKARELVLKNVEETMNLEIANLIKEKEEEALLEVDKKSKSLLVSSMQRYAADVSGEQTVTVVTLPNDEMKGRIIGREGRNIKTIEAVTGVDLIIDDTPEAIVLSSFDPYRRELARITLDTLIKDGRIHPSRVEEVYEKTCNEMSKKVREYGENALFELGLTKVDPTLIDLLGKLHFRTSYGQNVLKHSVEVAHLTGLLAAELGENVIMAKRAGLFHDIGKAIDHEIEGSHVTLGAELARKYNEAEVVINAIESHHGDKPATSIISSLVAVADALSASRPGARNDSLENYVKRLKDLEEIGNKMDGVLKTYAVQAGRELRVIVKPDKINDAGSYKVAREIKTKIEDTLQYPGTIKVTVIRELRVIEEAK